MKTKLFSALTITLISASAAFADTITTTNGFGPLAGATFSGTGIPNNPVAITQINDTTSGDSITLGLSATSKYPNPPVGTAYPNNGAGTFYVPAGSGLSPAGDAAWNFDFYINLVDTSGATYLFDLVINGPNSLSHTTVLGSASASGTSQDSENLGFGFLPGFNPDTIGQYTFDLEVLNANGAPVGSDTLNVNTVPDTASTALLLGLGLGGLAFVGFAKKCLRTT
jgi:hypothetical protein